MRPTTSLLYIVLLSIIFCTTYCQTNEPTDEPKDSDTDDTFSAPWLFTMIISGIIGIIFIAVTGIQSIYHFYHDNTNVGLGRILYIIFFITNWLTCIGYAFFRIDIILPMGSIINCKLGFYLTTNGVFLSKLALFTIFVYRIDLAFHSSALGYPRPVLVCTMISYIVGIIVLNIMFMIVTWPLVKLVSAEYAIFDTIGMCTTGTVTSNDLYTLTLGLLFLGDTIFTIFVCVLFVYKLKKVVAMARGDRAFSSQSENERQRTRKLTKVIRKQTILVLIASISSFAVFAGGALLLPGLSLMMPVDGIINTFCIWLMFSFADPIWNKIVKTCCFCCFCTCCGSQKDYTMTMRTLRGLSSIRSRIGSTTPDGDNEKPSKREDFSSANQSGQSGAPLTSIVGRNSTKHPDVELNFQNDIQSSDLQKNQNGDEIEMQVITPPIERHITPAIANDAMDDVEIITSDNE
eukprot:207402_1